MRRLTRYGRAPGGATATAVLTGGLLAGFCDIVYACVLWKMRADVPPIRVLQSVASGLLGNAAREGGWAAAALGLFLHFLIAILWAAIFYAAARRVSALWRLAVTSGIAYGVFIYAAMNLVVVPLSAFPRKLSFPPVVFWTGLLVHMFLIGLAIALSVRRAFEAPAAAAPVPAEA